MRVVKEFTPLIIAAKGRIVNVASMAGLVSLVDFFFSVLSLGTGVTVLFMSQDG